MTSNLGLSGGNGLFQSLGLTSSSLFRQFKKELNVAEALYSLTKIDYSIVFDRGHSNVECGVSQTQPFDHDDSFGWCLLRLPSSLTSLDAANAIVIFFPVKVKLSVACPIRLMFATRRVCRSSGAVGTLLPRRTFLGLLVSAGQGAWTLASDETSRETYERLVKTGVIKDAVLSNAPHGAILTYALFHDLQNPLWSEHQFDAAELVTACQPALENFHVALGQLRNSLAEEEGEGVKKKENGVAEGAEPVEVPPHKPAVADVDRKNDDTAPLPIPAAAAAATAVTGTNPIDVLFGTNVWREQATSNPNSLAGVVSRMTTDACLDALYYTSKLNVVAGVQGHLRFCDSAVNEVALLAARAEEVDDDEDAPYNEFQATDDLDRDFPVAAQVDVLFEVTHTFQEKSPSGNNDTSEDDPSTTASDDAKPASATLAAPTTKELSVTSLAVAVFEGWLHGGPKHRDRQLRWKLATIREAHEFPQSAALTRQQ